MYWEGITSVFNKLHLEYYFSARYPSEVKPNEAVIRFKDSYFVYKDSLTTGLLMNGIKVLDTENHNMEEYNSEEPYIEYFKKVYGKTAIPAGEYEITLHIISPKYSKKPWFVKFCGAKMPRILNIPGYDGVLIHEGNSDKDTCGCVLVGKNTVVGKVLESKNTFAKLYPILKAASDKGERITINIK